MADYIRTNSGVYFYPLAPKEEDIRIEDIAHALSLMTRANGHFPEFYSVGQHCLACCNESIACGNSNRVSLACLLHDAGEAYLADITRPVKRHLDFFIDAENRLLNMIYKYYIGSPLTKEEQDAVSQIDDAMLYYEFVHFTGEEIVECTHILKSAPDYSVIPFKSVEQQYIEQFNILKSIL